MASRSRVATRAIGSLRSRPSWGASGARVEEAPDGLVVHGGAPLHAGRIDTHRDHRIAMAFTAIGAVVPGVEISDPGCVAKTYPGFFDDVARLGVGIR